MHKVYLSLGSNMGDKTALLNQAVEIIQGHDGVENVRVSSFYQTDPVGYLDQDVFVNIAIELETSMSPYEMLNVCQKVETELDRVRVIRWGPRTIDVDIIVFDQVEMGDEALTIPHPRAHERAFVLVPIKELNPAVMIHGKTVENLLKSLDSTGVRKI